MGLFNKSISFSIKEEYNMISIGQKAKNCIFGVLSLLVVK